MKISCLYRVLIILSILSIQACVSVPFPAQQRALLGEEKEAVLQRPTAPGRATVYFMQEGINEALYYLAIGESENVIARWDVGYVRLDLLPGTYKITGAGHGTSYTRKPYYWRPTQLTVNAGETKYLILGADRSNRKSEPVWNTVLRNYPGGATAATRAFGYLPLLESNTNENLIYPKSIENLIVKCTKQELVDSCKDLMTMRLANGLSVNLSVDDSRVANAIIQKEKDEIQKQEDEIARRKAIESSIPPEIRMDKYMLELTDLLKSNKYKESLPVFEKIVALNLPLDPNFNYFRGEAFLKSGDPTSALKYLYDYVAKEGRNSAFYQDALKLINQAENEI